MSGRASRTSGTPEEVSTVGIDLLRHRLKGTTVEFYDCAGQVDYAGMHQTFLSRRALYVVVWDVGRCHGKDGEALDEVGGGLSPCIEPQHEAHTAVLDDCVAILALALSF